MYNFTYHRASGLRQATNLLNKLEEAKLAAEIEYDKRHGMGAHAIAEVNAAQDEHDGHMPMVPVTPIKPRRAVTTSVEGGK